MIIMMGAARGDGHVDAVEHRVPPNDLRSPGPASPGDRDSRRWCLACPWFVVRPWSELDAESRSSRVAGLFRVDYRSGRHGLTAPMGGQRVRYLLCGLFPAAQGRPPLSCGGP